VLTNTTSPVDDLGFATLQTSAVLAMHKTIIITTKAEDEYVGSYQRKMRNVLKIFRTDDQLYAKSGEDAYPIYASARDEFFARSAGISFSFQRDASHKIDALVLHGDSDIVLPRLSDADAAAATHDAPANAAAGQKTVALDAATLAGYLGHYQLAPGAMMDITLKDGQMLVQLTGQDALPIYASAKDKFFLKVVDAQIDFERDAKGKVIALILHQNGANQRALRTGD